MIFQGFSDQQSIDVLFQEWETRRIFFPIDLAWGRLIKEHFSTTDPDIIFTVIFLSHLVSQNHLLLSLDYWAGKSYPEEQPLVIFDSKKKWLQSLFQSNLFIQGVIQMAEKVGNLSSHKDNTYFMVLDESKLYFNKYYYYEQAIAQMFGGWVREGRLLIVTGGPGTGKTTRVFIEIFKYLQDNPEARIALLAPTGKAAGRLREAVRMTKVRELGKKGVNTSLINSIPETTYTVHRFLDTLRYPTSINWRKSWDLVVLDEASMISLPLFYELLKQVRGASRLILLGDKDQLSSVEEGSLFYELVDGESSSPLSSQIDFLTKNYRYPDDSYIAQVAEEIRNIKSPLSSVNSQKDNNESETTAYSIFVKSKYSGSLERMGDLVYFPDFNWVEINKVMETYFIPNCRTAFIEIASYLKYLEESNPLKDLSMDQRLIQLRNQAITSLFKLHKKQAILCAHRKGKWGVEEMNQAVEVRLRRFRQEFRCDWLEMNDLRNRKALKVGDPVMISRNRYELGLYNGDIGITLPVRCEKGFTNKIFFEIEDKYQEFSPDILGNYELAHAMTIHKSQGSEFDQVMVIMGGDSGFLSREICYTAITRARKQVFFFMSKDSLHYALNRLSVRHSGLRGALQKWITFKPTE